MDGSPKFSVISLPTCHALETPPESPGARLRSLSVLNSDLIHLNAPLLLASIATRMSPSGWLTYEAESLKGGASPLRPMGFAVYASVVSFIRFLLSFTPARLATNRVASPCSSFQLQRRLTCEMRVGHCFCPLVRLLHSCLRFIDPAKHSSHSHTPYSMDRTGSTTGAPRLIRAQLRRNPNFLISLKANESFLFLTG